MFSSSDEAILFAEDEERDDALEQQSSAEYIDVDGDEAYEAYRAFVAGEITLADLLLVEGV